MNDNAASTVVVDSSGNSNDGVSSANTNTVSGPGKINEAFTFDGIANVVAVPLLSDTSIYSNSVFSISIWVKSNPLGSVDICGNLDSSPDAGWVLGLDGSDRLYFTAKYNTVDLNTLTSSSFSSGSWKHVIVIVENDEAKIYINNSLNGSRTDGTGGSKDDSVLAVNVGDSNRGFNLSGDLDDFRFYNFALTFSQRSYIYNSGNGTEDSYFPSTVTTQAVTDIDSITATGNGNITELGIPDPTAHGVCWNTTGSPTISDDKTDEGVASATGAFTSDMTGLSGRTTYYVKAYVTDQSGTSYGDEVSFTTLSTADTDNVRAAIRAMGQKAIYWEYNELDDFGKPYYCNPVEIDCRWEDVVEEIILPNSDRELSRATVTVDRDMNIKDILKLGELISSISNDPNDEDDAWEILMFNKIPNHKNTRYYRKALL
jgi:hypothetical protein